MEFFSQYPIIKWILVGFGILYVLDKYGIFSPIDNPMDRIGKYKFTMSSHLNRPTLKALILYFNNKQFNNVEQSLKEMNESYRAFAFKCLGQYGEPVISDEWMAKESNNTLPKIIKSYQLIHKARGIRGRGTIDSVSNQKHLGEARDLLVTIDKNSTSYYPNCVSSLLKIYKSLEVDRQSVHELFTNTAKNYSDNIELHFNYFSFISPKWGGSEEEYNSYLNQLNQQTPFIHDLILAQYYFDLEYFQDYKDEDKKMENFMETIKNNSYESDLLFQYELYLIVYWLSSNLGLKGLEKHFKNVLKPYWLD